MKNKNPFCHSDNQKRIYAMRRETENVLKMWLNMSKSVEEWSCDIVMGYDKTSRTKPLLKVANIQQKGN